MVAFNESGRKLALHTTSELRKDGSVVEFSLFNDIEESRKYAINNGFGGILYFKNDEMVEIININSGDTNEVHISELLGGADDEE